jgi:hypothetical protein
MTCNVYKRLPPALLLLCCIVSCGHSNNRDAQLDIIEKSISLPSGAAPLEKYSRYYAPSGDGRISGLYVIQSDLYMRDATDFCKHSRAIVFPCGPKPGDVLIAPAGERRWLKSPAELPVPNGGGCEAITFSYDSNSRTFSDLHCNGSN